MNYWQGQAIIRLRSDKKRKKPNKTALLHWSPFFSSKQSSCAVGGAYITILRWLVFLVYIPLQNTCRLFTYLIVRWKGETFRFYAHNMYRGPTLPPTAPRHPNRHRLRRGDQTKGTLGNLCKSASYSSVQNSEINFRQRSELYLQIKPIRCKTWFLTYDCLYPFRLNWMLYY